MKNCKRCCEAQTASQIKSYYVFTTNKFLWRYTEVHRHVLSKCFENAVIERHEMVQCKCFLPIQNRGMFVGKIV